ncbi:hypothetical protein A2Y85_07005 [candidate division WOR-3 bacterium RBG_13_43_14]|uniref:Uncharacterized protein n=1 Tax=candidate division WOR-3 bacterium RBG_13_43_14 TaxID=1802590 RepID=A0A1F4UAX1_UNCW3|nr:MAG: hypothetical protein A2Y85_07005 [candidate division WOR-3 bacterium RBG_13_43_14]
MSENLVTNYIWENLKENRGKYFVEYIPLRDKSLFASLNLVFLSHTKARKVANAMEREFSNWVSRFPVPLMVSSFDEKGNLISLNGVRPINHMVGFIDISTNKPVKYWRLLPDDAFPKEQLKENYIKKIYNGLSFKTKEELHQQNEPHRKQLRIGLFIIFVWIVIVPAIVAILGWASFWVSSLVLIYSLWKAIEKGLKLKGKWKKSEKERQKEKEELKMRYYYYHCERNPEGFRKLVVENLERDERDRIRKEADFLRKK